MSVLDVLAAARDLGRLQEIVRTLARHGLGDLVAKLHLTGPLQRAGRAFDLRVHDDFGPMSLPERVRRALEQLGPTFVKFGQLLASRPDLVPPDWVEELSKLQEHVTSVPWDEIAKQLEEDLGAPPAEVFGDLDTEPLAAGSIAQVHRASLEDGTPVVLKVRRPGIRSVCEADMRLIARVAEIAESDLPELARYRPRKLVRHFARTLRDELDLSVEARHTQQMAQALRKEPGIVLPAVHDAWTREALVVLGYLEGVSVGEWLRTREPADVDGPAVARVGADAILRMVFLEGFFHADPHPGNLLLLPDGRVGLLDCGMVGRLSDARRREFVGLLSGALRRDERRVVDVLLRWSEDEDDVDLDMLAGDARAFIDRYHGAALGNVRMADLLGDVVDIVRDNGLFLPPDVSSLLRVLVLLDGIGRELDPRFDLASRAEPFANRALRRQLSLRRVIARNGRDVFDLVSELPRDLREILSKARRGRFKLELEHKRLDEFAEHLDRSANRVTMGLVTAALIVGTSIVMTVDGGPTLLGLPAFALLGFLSSIGFGLALLWSIWRSGR